MRSLGASPKPRSVQFKIQLTSAVFKCSWPSAATHYHLEYFWHTPTHTLCSIKTTCCAASLSRRRSYSSRRGLTGNCYRALSRRLNKEVNDFAPRITEAQLFERSCYRVTSEERVCYRTTTLLLSGPSWRAWRASFGMEACQASLWQVQVTKATVTSS